MTNALVGNFDPGRVDRTRTTAGLDGIACDSAVQVIVDVIASGAWNSPSHWADLSLLARHRWLAAIALEALHLVISAWRYLTRAVALQYYASIQGCDAKNVLIPHGSCIVDSIGNVPVKPAFFRRCRQKSWSRSTCE